MQAKPNHRRKWFRVIKWNIYCFHTFKNIRVLATSPNYTDHPKLIYTQYTVLKIFSLFRIFEQLALGFKNRVFPQIFTVLSIFLTIQDFSATLHLPWKTEFALKSFTVFNILFTFRIFEQLALALNSLYWIYIFYSDVRWGSRLGRHCLFQSQICECMNWME